MHGKPSSAPKLPLLQQAQGWQGENANKIRGIKLVCVVRTHVVSVGTLFHHCLLVSPRGCWAFSRHSGLALTARQVCESISPNTARARGSLLRCPRETEAARMQRVARNVNDVVFFRLVNSVGGERVFRECERALRLGGTSYRPL